MIDFFDLLMVLYQIYDSLLNYVACHENFTAVTMWGDEQNLSYPFRVVLMAITVKYNYSLVCISVKALACAGSSPRDPAGTGKLLFKAFKSNPLKTNIINRN